MSPSPLIAAEPSLRIALLSDTHNAVDRRIVEVVESCDLAVHAGDIGSPQVLAQLLPRSGRVFAVRGNNDTAEQWPRGTERSLRLLPESLSIDVPGGVVVVVHGHRARPAMRRHQILRERYPMARAIVYGHTHRVLVDDEFQPWVLNPGAAGHTRNHGAPSCLVLTATLGDWHVDVHAFAD
ncbi:MAG: metallophosphoesterase family protein [Pseudomonadota bacterium]